MSSLADRGSKRACVGTMSLKGPSLVLQPSSYTCMCTCMYILIRCLHKLHSLLPANLKFAVYVHMHVLCMCTWPYLETVNPGTSNPATVNSEHLNRVMGRRSSCLMSGSSLVHAVSLPCLLSIHVYTCSWYSHDKPRQFSCSAGAVRVAHPLPR